MNFQTVYKFVLGSILATQIFGCGFIKKQGSTSSSQRIQLNNVVDPSALIFFDERFAHSLTKLDNGTFLISGGENESDILSEVLIYDPKSNSISVASPLSESRSYHQSTLLLDGKVLITGGYQKNFDSRIPISSAEVFEPSSSSWSSVAPMNVARVNHSSTLLNDGRVLVVGGNNENGDLLSSSEIYDPQTNTWSFTKNELKDARSAHFAAIMKNGKVIVMGGFGIVTDTLNTVEVYDPALDEWSSVSSFNTGRYRPSYSQLKDGRIMVAGGVYYTDQGEEIAKSVEIYNPITDAWSMGPAMNDARFGQGSGVLSDGKVVVTGGRSTREIGILKSTEYYDPSENRWFQLNDSVYPHFFINTLILDHEVFVIGGNSYYGTSSVIEKLDITKGNWTLISEMKPRVLDVSTAVEKGFFFEGDSIEFSLKFSEAVSIVGNPRIVINVGDTEVYADAVTSGVSDQHVFRYTVSASESSDQGIQVNQKFNFIDGSIVSNSTNLKLVNFFYRPNTDSFSINPAAPYIVSIDAPVAGKYRDSYSVDFVVNFSEPVTITRDPMLSLPSLKVRVGDRDQDAYATTTGTSNSHIFRWVVVEREKERAAQSIESITSNGNPIHSASSAKELISFFVPKDISHIIVAPRSAPLVNHFSTEVLMPDNRKIMACGQTDNGVSSAFEIYDPVTDVWTQLASLAESRMWHETVVLNDGRVLVFGGVKFVIMNGGWLPIKATEVYSFSNNKWVGANQDLSVSRFNTSSIVLNNGKVLVVGGRGEASSFLDSVELFDPITDSWTLLAPLGMGPRAYHTLEIVDDHTVRIKGGYNWNGQSTVWLPDEDYIIP
jgi:N-acetylneuraminic acid mutarotase